jgi:sarcosine oxidase subunit alpha
MTQSHRLPAGGRIDRSKPIRFSFNGRIYEGYAGDTLASALLANGVRFVARSFKYHRPRGIVAAGVEEPNAIVQLESGAYAIPNARATEIELYEGLSATSVNADPDLEDDRLGFLQRLGRFIPAGFYYKTFMWPQKLWPKYEALIRKAAGLGKAPTLRDADRYDKTYAHCDVLVVGAGRAGLAAAHAAAVTGRRVMLIDDQPEPGGSLLSRAGAEDSAMLAVAALRAMPEVTLLLRTTVFGYHDHNFLTACERLTDHLPITERRGPRERMWKIRAKEVILATGAHERGIVFGNNDLPGIMLASAASTYVNRYAVKPGQRAIVFTNNASAYRTALDLHDIGARVTIVDSRAEAESAFAAQVREQGIPILDSSVVAEAHGKHGVNAVTVWSPRGSVTRHDCDLVCMSGGWNPALHLFAQSGGRATWSEAKACFVPGERVQPGHTTGAASGETIPDVAPLWLVGDRTKIGRGAKQFVDYQNDVTAADIFLAAREGYTSVEHMKRYTTLGFGTDQGKLGNINGMAILAEALRQSIPETGTTTFRPNYTPVSFGLYAGRELADDFEPIRKTCIHDWHAARGAVFEDVGNWKRPFAYLLDGEDLYAAVARESLAVRRHVGLFDASTLGKIDVQGPDAVTLLNRVYTNAWNGLAIGKCRYGLMLDENGMVFDDGVTTRLGEHHYLMSTTTGGAARVLNWMERWLQTEWPHLKVHLASVTDHFATFALAGPEARNVMQKVCSDIDFAPAAFPFMSCREGPVAGIAARVMRISFSGELAYEVNVPARYGQQVWDALMAAGEEHGITPYGTEAMHVLRAEKGYVIVGQDTDGSVTPHDLGMHALVSKDKDFLGKRSLTRADTAAGNRKQLVGLLAWDERFVLPEGSQIVEAVSSGDTAIMIGHVTSSYMSATLDRSIALALVNSGRERIGQEVVVSLGPRKHMRATVCSPVFYDPEGSRLRG